MSNVWSAPPMMPGTLARTLQKRVRPHPFVDAPWRWGTVVGAHAAGMATLGAGLTAGDRQVTLSMPSAGGGAPVARGAWLQIAPPETNFVQVVSVSNAGTNLWRCVIGVLNAKGIRSQVSPTTQASGTAVRVMPTVDVQINGATGFIQDGLGAPNSTAYGLRYMESYLPQKGDQVILAHIQASDWVVMGKVSDGAPAWTSAAGLAVSNQTNITIVELQPVLNNGAGHLYRVNWSAAVNSSGTMTVVLQSFDAGSAYQQYATAAVANPNSGTTSASTTVASLALTVPGPAWTAVWGFPTDLKWNATVTPSTVALIASYTGTAYFTAQIERVI